ncbi:MAG: hypothetical protein IPK32_14435 [Verrucomicrobiaceae bacterium]|nr:hypothetical protein [Verrucomicrobiaceae bacterium]
MKRWLFIVAMGFCAISGVAIAGVITLRLSGMIGIYHVPQNGMAPFIQKGDRVVAEAFPFAEDCRIGATLLFSPPQGLPPPSCLRLRRSL